MAVYEDMWDCRSCSSANLGRHKDCPKCGVSRPIDVVFYPQGGAAPVTDPDLLKMAHAGPDQRCAHCGSSKAPGEPCSNCASTQHDKQRVVGGPAVSINRSMEAKVEQIRKERDREIDRAIEDPELVGTKINPPQYSRLSLGSKPHPLKLWLPAAGVALVAITVYALIVTGYKTETMTVSDMMWSRTIQMQDLRTVRETDWSNRLPPGARIVRTWQAVRSYSKIQVGTESYQDTEKVKVGSKKVKVGTRSLENGFREDVYETRPVYENRTVTKTRPVYADVPNYDTKAEYDIDRWFNGRIVFASQHNKDPVWPTYTLRDANERESGRSAEYKITLKGTEVHTRTVNEAEYMTFTVGQSYAVKMWYGSIRELTALER